MEEIGYILVSSKGLKRVACALKNIVGDEEKAVQFKCFKNTENDCIYLALDKEAGFINLYNLKEK